MNCSLNEVDALCRKAARGAGYSWGLAEDAGKAARWLHANDLPGATCLAHLLNATDGVAYKDLAPQPAGRLWRAAGGLLCPIATGCALNDCAHRLAQDDSITLGPMRIAILLLPFAAAIATQTGRAVGLSQSDLRIVTDGTSLWVDGDRRVLLAPRTADCVVEPADIPDSTATGQNHTRARLSPETYDRLAALAQRTYAPATEASRTAGAGAGLTDND